MKKKILGVAWLLMLTASLTVISNIQEEERMPEPIKEEKAEAQTSEDSFTPESEENTIVN